MHAERSYTGGMPTVPQLQMDWVVNLVNEYADLTRAAAGEQDQPYPEMSSPEPGDCELPSVSCRYAVRLANELHEVFKATHLHEPEAPALNAIFRRTRPWPQLETGSATTWTVDAMDPEGVVAAAAALALLQFLQQHGPNRLGLCAATSCVDVYADNSPAGQRRFCSNTCLNRHKVAAHRSRQRRAAAVRS